MPKEQLDSEGNTIQVANLTFIEGILGKGAYGTVRLARRKLVYEEDNSNNDDTEEEKKEHLNEHKNVPQPASPFGDAPMVRLQQMQQQARANSKLKLALQSPTPPSASSTKRALALSGGGGGGSGSSTVSRRPGVKRHSSAPSEELSAAFYPTGDNNSLQRPEPKSSTTPQRRTFKRRSMNHTSPAEEEEEEQLVAVKIFHKSILRRTRTMERTPGSRKMMIKTALQQVYREIALMKKLSHPNLVGFYDAIDSPDSDMLYIVIEYMPLGEILSYQNDGTFRRKEPKAYQKELEGLVDGHFDEYHSALYFVDVMHGLAYLHQHHIIHRDLKPENILLDARGIARLADFGVAHIFDEQELESAAGEAPESRGTPRRPSMGISRKDTDEYLKMKTMSNIGLLTKTEGTRPFWSPEMCGGSNAFSGYAADIWAAGVCLYIFVTGRLPFYNTDPMDLMELITEANVPFDGFDMSESLVDLLKMTMEPDPEKRFGVGDCLQHPFLLEARNFRINQLDAELRKSQDTNTRVEEHEIMTAFRIVTALPVVFLQTATRHIQQGVHIGVQAARAARRRLSLGKRHSDSFSDQETSDRSLVRRPSGDGSSSMERFGRRKSGDHAGPFMRRRSNDNDSARGLGRRPSGDGSQRFGRRKSGDHGAPFMRRGSNDGDAPRFGRRKSNDSEGPGSRGHSKDPERKGRFGRRRSNESDTSGMVSRSHESEASSRGGRPENEPGHIRRQSEDSFGAESFGRKSADTSESLSFQSPPGAPPVLIGRKNTPEFSDTKLQNGPPNMVFPVPLPHAIREVSREVSGAFDMSTNSEHLSPVKSSTSTDLGGMPLSTDSVTHSPERSSVMSAEVAMPPPTIPESVPPPIATLPPTPPLTRPPPSPLTPSSATPKVAKSGIFRRRWSMTGSESDESRRSGFFRLPRRGSMNSSPNGSVVQQTSTENRRYSNATSTAESQSTAKSPPPRRPRFLTKRSDVSSLSGDETDANDNATPSSSRKSDERKRIPRIPGVIRRTFGALSGQAEGSTPDRRGDKKGGTSAS